MKYEPDDIVERMTNFPLWKGCLLIAGLGLSLGLVLYVLVPNWS